MHRCGCHDRNVLSCFSSVPKVSSMVILLRVSWPSTRYTTPTSLCAVTAQRMTSLMLWREIGKPLKCQNWPSLVIPSRCGLGITCAFPLHQCRNVLLNILGFFMSYSLQLSTYIFTNLKRLLDL